MSPNTFPSWQVWAVLSAAFAALTAIFAKIGVEDINSDLATLIRTVVVLLSLSLILFATGQFNQTGPISTKSWIFLVLSGLGTGASWICYFRALKLGPATLVAPIDKLSVVLVALFGVVFLGERPSLNGWLGIALIATGAVLIAFKRKQRSGRGPHMRHPRQCRIETIPVVSARCEHHDLRLESGGIIQRTDINADHVRHVSRLIVER